MSLYGMMRTGVSGMNAQANRLSTVADNIANSSTTGYKRASTQFASLVLPSSGGAYNSGGVETVIRRHFSDDGSQRFTTSSTDLALKGNGFFIVGNADDTPYLTRAGSFVPDAQGNLVNSAGYYLMGYPVVNGNVNPVANGFQGLEKVNIAQNDLIADPARPAYLRPISRQARRLLPRLTARRQMPPRQLNIRPRRPCRHLTISATLSSSISTSPRLQTIPGKSPPIIMPMHRPPVGSPILRPRR